MYYHFNDVHASSNGHKIMKAIVTRKRLSTDNNKRRYTSFFLAVIYWRRFSLMGFE